MDAICDKMTRRHPHVFGEGNAANSGEVLRNWEALKAQERAESKSDSSALSGVALALPALLRAQKIQKRAARTGFDWPDTQGPKAKIAEELQELEEAVTEDHRFEEMGDLLFAAVNLSRHYGIDAELALGAATRKFEKRFRKMEDAAGEAFKGLSLAAKEELWLKAKQNS
jgi:nucleoside triphosphate diphosphatase